MEISFYHLTTTPLETALPKLLEKSLQADLRAVVVLESDEKVEEVNNLLWTYNPASFLPHGSGRDGNREMQPIYLTSTLENPNQANLLLIANGLAYTGGEFSRVLDVFDGSNEQAVTAARERWKQYKETGASLKYMKQAANGSWQQAS